MLHHAHTAVIVTHDPHHRITELEIEVEALRRQRDQEIVARLNAEARIAPQIEA